MEIWKYKPPLGYKADPQRPLAQGLVGGWLFNESGGIIARDISGYGNHGTLTSMAFPPTATSGWNPGGVAFDGGDDYITIANKQTPSSYTIFAKAKRNTISTTWATLVSCYNQYGDSIFVYENGIVRLGDAGSAFATFSGLWTDKTQFHTIASVVPVRNNVSTTFLCFFDGTYIGSGTGASTISAVWTTINVGQMVATHNSRWNGIIEYLYIFNRSLTPSQIAELTAEPYSIIWKPTYSRLFVPTGGGTTYYANLSDSVSLGDSLYKSASIVASDTVSLGDNIAKLLSISESDSIALSDNIIKTLDILQTDTIALSDVVVQGVGKVLSDTVSLNDVITGLVIALGLSDTVGVTDSGVVQNIDKVESDTITLSDTLVKNIDVNTLDTVAISESLVKSLGISLADAVTISDSAISSLLYVLNLTDSISITDAGLTQQIVIHKSDTVGISDGIVKSIGQTISDTVTLADVLVKLIQLGLADNINISDDVDVTTVTITVGGYTISFTAKKPKIDFTAKKPKIDFTGK